MLLGVSVASIVALRCSFNWHTIQNGMVRGITNALPATIKPENDQEWNSSLGSCAPYLSHLRSLLDDPDVHLTVRRVLTPDSSDYA
jgi:hypothetical protein